MCGRFAQAIPLGKLKMTGLFDETEGDYMESFNVAPSHYASVVSVKDGKRVLSLKKWGLVPSWSKDDKTGSRLINARGETLKEKPSFRNAFKKRRCVIPVTGFYEWKNEAGLRKPYFVVMKGGSETPAMLLAGLSETWNRPDGEALETFTVITTSACDRLREIHDRMPVIILQREIDTWFNDAAPINEIEKLIRPADDNEIEFYPVSDLVNSPKNNSVKCLERL